MCLQVLSKGLNKVGWLDRTSNGRQNMTWTHTGKRRMDRRTDPVAKRAISAQTTKYSSMYVGKIQIFLNVISVCGKTQINMSRLGFHDLWLLFLYILSIQTFCHRIWPIENETSSWFHLLFLFIFFIFSSHARLIISVIFKSDNGAIAILFLPFLQSCVIRDTMTLSWENKHKSVRRLLSQDTDWQVMYTN